MGAKMLDEKTGLGFLWQHLPRKVLPEAICNASKTSVAQAETINQEPCTLAAEAIPSS
jgi:hypothetical protein